MSDDGDVIDGKSTPIIKSIQTLMDVNEAKKYDYITYDLDLLTSDMKFNNSSGINEDVLTKMNTIRVNSQPIPISEIPYSDEYKYSEDVENDDNDDKIGPNEYKEYLGSSLYTWPKYITQNLKQETMNPLLIAECLFNEYITGAKDYIERAMHKLFKSIIERNKVPQEERFVFQFYAYTHATKIRSLLQTKEISQLDISKNIIKRQFIAATKNYKMNVYPELYN